MRNKADWAHAGICTAQLLGLAWAVRHMLQAYTVSPASVAHEGGSTNAMDHTGTALPAQHTGCRHLGAFQCS